MVRWSLKRPVWKGVCEGPARRMSRWVRSSSVVEVGGKR